MAKYKVSITITQDALRRGARETLRYRLLKMLGIAGVSQATRRSLRIRKVA